MFQRREPVARSQRLELYFLTRRDRLERLRPPTAAELQQHRVCGVLHELLPAVGLAVRDQALAGRLVRGRPELLHSGIVLNIQHGDISIHRSDIPHFDRHDIGRADHDRAAPQRPVFDKCQPLFFIPGHFSWDDPHLDSDRRTGVLVVEGADEPPLSLALERRDHLRRKVRAWGKPAHDRPAVVACQHKAAPGRRQRHIRQAGRRHDDDALVRLERGHQSGLPGQPSGGDFEARITVLVRRLDGARRCQVGVRFCLAHQSQLGGQKACRGDLHDGDSIYRAEILGSRWEEVKAGAFRHALEGPGGEAQAAVGFVLDPQIGRGDNGGASEQDLSAVTLHLGVLPYIRIVLPHEAVNTLEQVLIGHPRFGIAEGAA